MYVYGGDGNCPGWARSKINLPNKLVTESRWKVWRANDLSDGGLTIYKNDFSTYYTGVDYGYFTFDSARCGTQNQNSFWPQPCVAGVKLPPYWQDTWFRQKLFYDGSSSSNNVKYIRDQGSGEESITHTASATSENLRLNIGPAAWGGEPNHRFYSDWIFVRKYASSEPTVNIGAEE